MVGGGPLARVPAVLTVDLEDYRRQETRDKLGGAPPANPAEVHRQLDLLLHEISSFDGRATFFTVGRLVRELPGSLWSELTAAHSLGAHGYEHVRVDEAGPAHTPDEVRRARLALEDASGQPVRAFRAPYFSVDGCDPWFGEALARAGYTLDSSTRLDRPPAAFDGAFPLPGSGGQVRSVPLHSVGWGRKRIAVIGGTYLRAFPLPVVRRLLAHAASMGFIPMVYLHPYDVDPSAPPLDLPGPAHRMDRWADGVRRLGRAGVGAKLRGLAEVYDFRALEDVYVSPGD